MTTYVTYDPAQEGGTLWFTVTLPGGYVLGAGFSVEVDTLYLPNGASVVGELSVIGGSYNGHSAATVTAGLYLNPGDRVLTFFDPTSDISGLPETPVTSVCPVPGVNAGFGIGGPPYAGGAVVLPNPAYDSGGNVIVQSNANFMDNTSNPSIDNYSLFAATTRTAFVGPSDVLLGTFGSHAQDAGGIPNGTVAFAAGDDMHVYVTLASFGSAPSGVARGLIAEIRTVIDGVTAIVPLSDLMGGFGTGNPGVYHAAHVLDHTPVSAPYDEMYLFDIAPPAVVRRPASVSINYQRVRV